MQSGNIRFTFPVRQKPMRGNPAARKPEYHLMPYHYRTPAPTFGPDVIQTLTDNIDRLPLSHRAFAVDLVKTYHRHQMRGWSLTPKQQHWAARLAQMATGRTEAPVEIGNLSGLIDLFDKAAQKVKHPAIVVASPVGRLRITVAGERSRCPGTVNVAEEGRYGEAYWYGRIDRDGVFTANKAGPTPPGLIDFLKRLAAEPATVAAEHGRQTGCCCFCNRDLTDPRSVEVGYGPICASTYQLRRGDNGLAERAA